MPDRRVVVSDTSPLLNLSDELFSTVLARAADST
jgi:hypothetical protein